MSIRRINIHCFATSGTRISTNCFQTERPRREGDNEYPILDARDTSVIGYAVNRFKDPYSAWLLRNSGFFSQQWILPVLEFLWNDPQVVPRDPALASETELTATALFPGVGHLVIRNGWKSDSTWIEFDCGPYLAKHQHLDQNQINIYHGGYLAIDSGADYTDSESPHYLNYYRRTVAHNSVLVYDPAEKFFWSENLMPAANDGGQRMDSSRYWNTIRSPRKIGSEPAIFGISPPCESLTTFPDKYHYAFGDATNAYSREKLKKFTREIVYVPPQNLLFVFDRVVSTKAAFRKAWLLHGVNPPAVDSDQGGDNTQTREFRDAKTFRFREGHGEILVHCLFPRDRVITRRGGPGHDFFTPGDDKGGAWGSGENWPLEPAEGGPLPQDPKLVHMWKKFWGEDFSRISPSNRKNVVPGGWRIEVSPASASEEDFFLHVFEIGNTGITGGKRVVLLEGVNFAGAASEAGPCVLFATSDSAQNQGEVSIPDVAFTSVTVSGLQSNAAYELRLYGPNVSTSQTAALPGVEIETLRDTTNRHGILRLDRSLPPNSRLRIVRI